MKLEKVIRETGTVVEVFGDRARIVIKRHASCESCNACGLGVKSEITMVAKNSLWAVPGDRVSIALPVGKFYQAAFLMYTVPLLMLFAGYFAGEAAGHALRITALNPEIAGIIGGVALMGLTYWVIYQWDQQHKFSARFQPELVAIIPATVDETPLSL